MPEEKPIDNKEESSQKLTQSDLKGRPKAFILALGVKNGALRDEKKEKELIEQERTKIKKKAFLEYYRKTLGSIKETCEKAMISRETYYEWMRIDIEFRKLVNMCFIQKLEDVESLANRKMLEGDTSMIRFFLERRHPLYKPKVKLEGVPNTGEKSIEEELREMEWVDNAIDYDQQGTEQLNGDSKTSINSEQAGNNSPVQAEAGTALLLPKTEEKKSDTKGAPGGNK